MVREVELLFFNDINYNTGFVRSKDGFEHILW